MTQTISTKRNRTYEHRFDHDEARQRHANGESLAALARRFGVTAKAIRYAVNQRARDLNREAAHRHQTSGICIDCGGPRAHNGTDDRVRVWPHQRCWDCWVIWTQETRGTSARPDELRCSRCQCWKPDGSFSRCGSESIVRRGRRRWCKECDAEARRGLRVRSRTC